MNVPYGIVHATLLMVAGDSTASRPGTYRMHLTASRDRMLNDAEASYWCCWLVREARQGGVPSSGRHDRVTAIDGQGHASYEV
jgi:hypothetical protein